MSGQDVFEIGSQITFEGKLDRPNSDFLHSPLRAPRHDNKGTPDPEMNELSATSRYETE